MSETREEYNKRKRLEAARRKIANPPSPEMQRMRAEYKRKWNAENAERLKSAKSAKYQANRAEAIARASEWAKANPDRRKSIASKHKASNKGGTRDLYLRRAYGITLEQEVEMVLSQGGLCAICLVPQEEAAKGRLCVDHCHRTGAVREMVCQKCNSAIGLLRDDPDLMRAAAAYVERHAERIGAS